MNGEIINLQVGSKSQVYSKSVFDSRRPQRTHSLDCHRGISLYMNICRGAFSAAHLQAHQLALPPAWRSCPVVPPHPHPANPAL